jgi:hypothetical protein
VCREKMMEGDELLAIFSLPSDCLSIISPTDQTVILLDATNAYEKAIWL